MQTKIVRHAFAFFISFKDWRIPTFYYFIKDEVRSNTISFSMILNSLFVRFIQHHDYYIIILLYYYIFVIFVVVLTCLYVQNIIHILYMCVQKSFVVFFGI